MRLHLRRFLDWLPELLGTSYMLALFGVAAGSLVFFLVKML